MAVPWAEASNIPEHRPVLCVHCLIRDKEDEGLFPSSHDVIAQTGG